MMTPSAAPTVRDATNRRQRFGSRAGQAALFGILNLTLLMGALGLGVDVGFAYFDKMQAQAAADAAAMAAAAYATNGGPITCGSNNVNCAGETACAYPIATVTDAFTTGCAYASANGFVNHGTQTVTMSANTTAPTGISGNSPTYWVKATVGITPPLLFGGFAGNAFTVKASATAGVAYYSAGACIYVLDPTASGALTAAGNTSVVSTCGIFVNSNSSSAFSVAGTASITSTQILVNGSSSIGSNASVTPTPTTNAGSQTDPLAGHVTPTVTNSCDYTNKSISSGATNPLSPGTYCGGISISGGSVQFASGLYILNGGGLSLGGNGTVTGSHVTFFNTGKFGQSAGAISMQGGVGVTLSAQDSGPYQGILFWQDPNVGYTATNDLTGGSNPLLTGTLYFPGTAVKYAGNTSGGYTALIAKTVTFTGTSNFKNDPTGYYTGLGTTIRGLIQ